MQDYRANRRLRIPLCAAALRVTAGCRSLQWLEHCVIRALTDVATTLNMATSQYEMYEAIEQSLARGVVFDPISGLARRFPPVPEFANVYVHPRLAFGHPVIGTQGVPTATLMRMWKAEGGNSVRVAKAFDTGVEQVNEAVAFERALALAT